MKTACFQNQSRLEERENKKEIKKKENVKISQKAVFYGLVKKKKTERNTNDLGVACRSLSLKKTDYEILVNLPKRKNTNLSVTKISITET